MKRALCFGVVISMACWAGPAAAQSATIEPDALQWAALVAAISLLPFVLIMVTSFVKLAVVLGILRNAFGAQGIPPAMIVTGLALILTVFIMFPVGEEMIAEATAAVDALPPAPEPSPREQADQPPDPEGTDPELNSPGRTRWEVIAVGAAAAVEPLRDFLADNAHSSDVALFVGLSELDEAGQPTMTADDFVVLIPAFAISELKEAFQIGFLVFLPFLVIDLVVANILMSLGMHMLSPTSVSLPFKLLLFVLVDGWVLLARGLVLGY